jgi:hypothetical protein
MRSATIILTALAFLPFVSSFHVTDKKPLACQRATAQKTSLSAVSSRRDWIAGAAAAIALSNALAIPANAEEEAVAISKPVLAMKEFVDPLGLFSLRVPKTFYTLRRTEKGDLPDAKTGKGRRGSSIFTAGDLAKAEVVAVERYVHDVFTSSFSLSHFFAVRMHALTKCHVKTFHSVF